MAAARGCSLERSRAAASRSRSASERPARDTIAVTLGLPSVSVPVLSTTMRVDLLQPLQRLGVLDQDAQAGAAADADHDRHRRGEAQGAGAGDDQHRDGGDQAVGERGRGAPQPPGDERERGDRDHRRHEPAGDLVGQPLDRRARALRLGHHLDDARQHRLLADLLRAHDEAAAAVERAADHLGPGLLLDRQRLAGDHALVDGARPFDHLAVDRHAVARPHAQPIARDAPGRASPPRRCRPSRSRRAVLGARSRSALMAPLVCSRARSSSTWPSSTRTVITAAASK